MRPTREGGKHLRVGDNQIRLFQASRHHQEAVQPFILPEGQAGMRTIIEEFSNENIQPGNGTWGAGGEGLVFASFELRGIFWERK